MSGDGPKLDGVVFDAPSPTKTGGAGHGRSGHSRAAMHRTTGK